MNCYLLGKIKNDGERVYKRLTSSDESFYEYTISESIEYTPQTLLDGSEDQWYVISDFSTKDYCDEILLSDFSSVQYSSIRGDEIDKLEYLCAYQNQTYCFQRIFKNTIFRGRKWYSINQDIQEIRGDKLLVLNLLPDAIYDRSKDKLYFRKLETIIPIFRGVESLYRDATDEETSTFLAQPFLEVVAEYGVENVGKDNRKRLALAYDVLNNLNKKQKKAIFDYVAQYCPELEYQKNKKFKIFDNMSLKKLLMGLCQRFYTTPITAEKLMANSVVKLK